VPAALARLGDPLQLQPLPCKLSALKDIFIAMQTVYEMVRRRGKRTTYTNLKAAVEEASGRRFTVSCEEKKNLCQYQENRKNELWSKKNRFTFFTGISSTSIASRDAGQHRLRNRRPANASRQLPPLSSDVGHDRHDRWRYPVYFA